ncbi:MAG: helix-turn-helix domain-containing protein [Pseudomonadota bacterium]
MVRPREPLGFLTSLDIATAARNVPEQTTLIHQDQPADWVYEIVSGTVRETMLWRDGHRTVTGFKSIGDCLGLSYSPTHATNGETITPVRLVAAKRSAVLAATADPAVNARLMETLAAELARAQAHGAALAALKAVARVAEFLLRLSKSRWARADAAVCDGHLATTIDLPMPRQDIADYLGLSLETVCRGFSNLRARGAIALPSARHVVVRKPTLLVSIVDKGG